MKFFTSHYILQMTVFCQIVFFLQNNSGHTLLIVLLYDLLLEVFIIDFFF